jgi:nicotinamidase-related amidase
MAKSKSIKLIDEAPEINALLVIDVQKGLFKKTIPIFKADNFLKNINFLVDKAHENDVPVIYIQHSNDTILVYGSDDWHFHSDIKPTDKDFLIHKKHGNAFEETLLGELLQSKSVNSLVITGLVTHGCVKATTIGALDLGYKVILVEDGHSSYSKDAADLIEKWNQKLSENGVFVKSAEGIKF